MVRAEEDMKTLASLCIICYNQERFIAEAVEGALAQTYRPLEIVISDDASTDRTCEVVATTLAAHGIVLQDGQWQGDGLAVMLVRQPVNLGVVRNWLSLACKAHGALLVKSDGDDVSLPNRVERIMAAWTADGARATVVCHGGWKITESGSLLGPMRRVTARQPVGTAMAFAREAMAFFGNVDEREISDDGLSGRRALMLGPELLLDDRLVKWRQGAGFSTGRVAFRNLVVRLRVYAEGAYRQALRDLELVRPRLGEAGYCQFKAELEGALHEAQAEHQLFGAPTFHERLRGWKASHWAGWANLWTYPKLMALAPRWLGDTLFFFYNILRFSIRRVGT